MDLIRRIYFALNKGSNVATKILEALVAILVVICFSSVFLQVIYRYILVKQTLFKLPFTFTFTDELARYALVWITYLCVGMCLKEGYMVSVDFIYNRLGKKARLALYYLICIMMAIVLAVIIFYGFRLLAINQVFKSTTMRIPGVYLFSAPIVGSILMGYELVTELFGVLSGELRPFKATKVE